MNELTIMLTGQIRGGKNSIKTTRTGHRYPSKPFAAWSGGAIAQAMSQRKGGPLAVELQAIVEYVPGDLRVRDLPALMDGVWHVLERSGVVDNDKLIKDCHWIEKPVERDNPRCLVVLRGR